MIRPCPPLSTPSQGAAASQAVSTAARAQSELKGLVDQMCAPVVQDRPGRVGLAAPAPRRGVAADRAFKEDRPADHALLEQLLHRQVVPVPAAVVEDREHAARAVAGGDHPVGVGRGEGHHLVDHAMFARIQGPDGQIGVAVVRGRDHDELDGGVGQGVRPDRHSHARPSPQSARASAADRGRREPRSRVSSRSGWRRIKRTVKCPARQAMADDDRC